MNLGQRSALRRAGGMAAAVVGVAIALSLALHVPYVFTGIGFSAWAFVGHVITIDDDIKGGFGNIDGTVPFPWRAFAVKAMVLAALCALAYFPAVRHFGAT